MADGYPQPRTALDGYVECAHAADFSDEEFEQYVAVLEKRTSQYGVSESFQHALDDFEGHH